MEAEVPSCQRRTSCTLHTLWRMNEVMARTEQPLLVLPMKTNNTGRNYLTLVHICTSFVYWSQGRHSGGQSGLSKKTGSHVHSAVMRLGVEVHVTLSSDAITKVEVTEQAETAGIADPALESIPQAIVDAQSVDVDAVSGATITSNAIIEAVTAALESAGVDVSTLSAGESSDSGNTAVTFTAGTYTGASTGYNGPVELDVTFSEDAITDIEVKTSSETAHVGTPAYDILFEDIKEAVGTGVDGVSGATFTTAAVRNAVNDAAEQAGVSDLAAFKKNTVVHEAGDPIEETYDVVVVGAGGAGIAAAAQAAQNGNTVLVIEENAEIGGNTLVSGGQYQSVMPYLVWDENDPDAAAGEYNGVTYDKVTNQAKGNLDTLRTILDWSEEPFNADYFNDHEYVAGDIDDLKNAGVHEDYLPILQTLKGQISKYLEWADAKIAAGAQEQDITLFSTLELHEFQTYYGGLRVSADGSEWIYGDVDLVKQFIEGGQDLKPWLEEQGSLFDESKQLTLIGALWYRENVQIGADLDGDGEAEEKGNWGAYFAAPRNTILVTSDTADQNEIMLRTKATALIVEDGRVTGVKAERYDGTEVTAHAAKGVVMATGGYAANIEMVQKTNVYWDDSYITDNTQTTNRSSLVGDGITMSEEAGAATTGMGFAQMMPISWVDNGNLAFGSGAYCVYINPTTGHRFVNETSERDVLSLAEFRNGVEHNGTQGVFMEISNADEVITPYLYKNADGTMSDEDVEWRQYVRTVDELDDLFDELGFEADAATVKEVIEQYDMAYMTDGEYPDVDKTGASRLIGTAEKNEDGSYNADTYTLDGVELRIRIMAPSTHHTMGGLSVDTERHVLDDSGNIIEGLYAAGEVTGGIHGGNRLGGNAIVEIFVSGRTAANAIEADNQ